MSTTDIPLGLYLNPLWILCGECRKPIRSEVAQTHEYWAQHCKEEADKAATDAGWTVLTRDARSPDWHCPACTVTLSPIRDLVHALHHSCFNKPGYGPYAPIVNFGPTRAVVQSPAFCWLPGMGGMRLDLKGAIQYFRVWDAAPGKIHISPNGGWIEAVGCVPDIADPATQGCLNYLGISHG